MLEDLLNLFSTKRSYPNMSVYMGVRGEDEFIVKVCLSWQVVYGLFFRLPCSSSGERAPFQLSWVTCNEGKYRQDDDCAVGEVDLRQLRGDVMDMIVQFLR